MKPGWFERKTDANVQSGARNVQFKAALLSAVPEDTSEIQLTVQCADEPQPSS
jgi:hypothetical protein